MMRRSHPTRIITVSREYGAGGAEVARRLSAALGWKLVDRVLIEQVAQRIGEPVDVVESIDEHVAGIVEQLGRAVAAGSIGPVLAPPPPEPDTIAHLEHAIIKAAADAAPAVVVGRGAQCLLAGRPDALHLRFIAPFAVRVARAAQEYGISVEDAEARARHADIDRARYVRHHFQREADDPCLYDLHINTGAISLDEATEIVLSLVAGRVQP